MAAPHRNVPVGQIRHVHASGTLRHGRPSPAGPSVSCDGAFVRGLVPGSAEKVEQYTGTELVGVETPQGYLNQDIFLPPAESWIVARRHGRGSRLQRLRGFGTAIFEELRDF